MTEVQIQMVWSKARIVEGFDKDRFRKDACGAWIQRSEYGNHKSQYCPISATVMIESRGHRQR